MRIWAGYPDMEYTIPQLPFYSGEWWINQPLDVEVPYFGEKWNPQILWRCTLWWFEQKVARVESCCLVNHARIDIVQVTPPTFLVTWAPAKIHAAKCQVIGQKSMMPLLIALVFLTLWDTWTAFDLGSGQCEGQTGDHPRKWLSLKICIYIGLSDLRLEMTEDIRRLWFNDIFNDVNGMVGKQVIFAC